jgi:3-methyladenine DNA glycosylase/8-oxoguanine DNA glycosylase
MPDWSGVRLYTVGHSTRTLDELDALLRSFGVSILADIRTVPRSRHNPQFNTDALARTLAARGVRYAHLAQLGGLRRARKDSSNTGWRNASFRGFADYMQTPEFEAGLDRLHALTAEGTVALMCAEAVPWRCHRSLVADALVARGAHVEHISAPARAAPHRMTAFAEVHGGHVTYPGDDGDDDDGVQLATRAPFHLEATVRVLQRRPLNRVDVWDDGRYLRAFATADGLVQLEVANRGTIDAPDVRYRVRHGRLSRVLRAGIERTLRSMLGLDLDPKPMKHVTEADRRLAPIGIALRGMRPPRFAGLFEAFANVVPFQQVSLDAGAAIVARLVERFGVRVGDGEGGSYAFPPAEAIGGARITALRACGLSARKAESLRHLARAVASGELSEATIENLSTSDALQVLGALPGIGPWSANLVLLRGFGRLDVFPPGDVGVARGLSALLHLPSPAALERLVARAGDRRGYLYFCSLGGALLAKGLIHAAPSDPQHPMLRSS